MIDDAQGYEIRQKRRKEVRQKASRGAVVCLEAVFRAGAGRDGVGLRSLR